MFTLSIVTQEKVLFEQEVISVIAPGSEGYLGILSNHAPLITSLMPGKLTVKDQDNKENIFVVSGGFLEVSKNVATILADAVESAGEIDHERAKKALERARERLGMSKEIDIPRAMNAKRRAEARLTISEEDR